VQAPILIFPAGMPRSLEYLQRCQREGQPVLGSSSLEYDVARQHYPAWAQLPFVNDPAFSGALRQLIESAGIGGIYTPNPVVWSYLSAALPTLAPGVSLVNAWPLQDELASYRQAETLAAAGLAAPLELAASVQPQPRLTAAALAALLRHASTIPGMCDDVKIAALCEIARHAPSGDLVEIGSAFGKSAFVLACLARRYGIGKLLCVDPWQSAYVAQHDEGGLVDNCIERYDYDEMLRVFEMSLLPYSAGDINYLRLPSSEAAARYATERHAVTDAFGSTDYTGRIALLHIDGNHSHDAVQADIDAWGAHLADGAWVVFDDYVWPYGDGPQRVGDAFLARRGSDIACAFVMGTALFVQLGGIAVTRKKII
jgi:hypothetical protein